MSSSRVAIVTGASSGIGEALSRQLVGLGWIVAMADINTNEALASELGDRARFYRNDVASYESQAETFTQVWRDFGRIDALCANAGIIDRGSPYLFRRRGASVDDVPPAPDMSCTDIDWKAVVYGTQLCVHFMRHNSPPGGSIVATASIVAMHPMETFPEYSGTKGAVLNWVRGTARLLKNKENIRINCIMPGMVPTPVIPQGQIDATGRELLTPIKTVIDGYVKFLDDESLIGQAVEASMDQHFVQPWPQAMNGEKTTRIVTVWEPVFEAIHGELSELPNAMPGESFVKK